MLSLTAAHDLHLRRPLRCMSSRARAARGQVTVVGLLLTLAVVAVVVYGLFAWHVLGGATDTGARAGAHPSTPARLTASQVSRLRVSAAAEQQLTVAYRDLLSGMARDRASAHTRTAPVFPSSVSTAVNVIDSVSPHSAALFRPEAGRRPELSVSVLRPQLIVLRASGASASVELQGTPTGGFVLRMASAPSAQ